MSGLIVHEWLEPRGGAEKVVDAMLETFPDSELVALWNDAPDKYPNALESWVARTPLRHHKAAALPFLPSTWRHMMSRRDDLDWVLVSSHLFAHHIDVRTRSGMQVPKFVYAHTPARYIWEPDLDERGKSLAIRAASSILKPLDRRRAQEAVKIAANSRFVRSRIQRTWHRDADVIYPPVDVETIQRVTDWRNELSVAEQVLLDSLPEGFILGASRFVPYKRLDKVIEFAAYIDAPVVIAGSGPEEKALRFEAKEREVRSTFVIRPSSALLFALYQQARVFVFPAIEDFGIMPVEAMAAGGRVIVVEQGGAPESVRALGGGVIAKSDSPTEFAAALEDEHSTTCRSGEAEMLFGRARFEKQVRSWICDAE